MLFRSTAHDNRRQVFTLFEYAKALELIGDSEEALATLDQVLTTASEDDPKDFEFIIEIESEIASILRSADRIEEAEEIERRLNSVRTILADEQSAQ